ncbi:MAG: PP2C family serine/threonine-protein phosphatase [Planctomycetota bacterium]
MRAPSQVESRFWIGSSSATVDVVDLGVGRVAVYCAASPLHPGRNEDAAATFTLPECAVIAVADGVGGLPDGEAASAHALEALGRSLSDVEEDPSATQVRNAMLDGFERGHDLIRRTGSGATTLVTAEVRDGTLRTFHTGDSAVLVVDRGGSLRLQTVAHSPVGYAMESGLINEEDALFHANRNVIFKCLGRDQMGIEVGWPLAIDERDAVLLASDGLLDNVTLAELVEALREPDIERSCAELGQLAEQRMRVEFDGKPSKPDDLTVAVFRCS